MPAFICHIDTPKPLLVFNETQLDVISGMHPWNELANKELFRLTQEKANAQVMVVDSSGRTWVDVGCGNRISTIYVGQQDAYRNQQWLSHELGHTLGLPDYCDGCNEAQGYRDPQPCGKYIGVMSYCTSPQSWFLNFHIDGYVTDYDLVRGLN